MSSHSYKESNSLRNLVESLIANQAATPVARFDPNSIDKIGNFFKNGETSLADNDRIAWVHQSMPHLRTPLTRAIVRKPFPARLGNPHALFAKVCASTRSARGLVFMVSSQPETAGGSSQTLLRPIASLVH